MIKAVNCKVCKKLPIFNAIITFEQEPSNKREGMICTYMNYKVDSQCDCPFYITQTFRKYDDFENAPSIASLIEKWNILNNENPA